MPFFTQEARVAISVSCVMAFAVYAFGFFGPAEAKRTDPAFAASTAALPSARDYAFYRGRLQKLMRKSPFAEHCGRGQISADAEIHVAMQFSRGAQEATEQAPGFAQAHVTEGDNPKVLIIDSAAPTLWTVTGKPLAVVITGKSVLAEYPDGVSVFAPAYAKNCRLATWIGTPSGWAAPRGQTRVDALIGEDVKSVYNDRASALSKGAFRRDFSSWQVKLGSVPFRF